MILDFFIKDKWFVLLYFFIKKLLYSLLFLIIVIFCIDHMVQLHLMLTSHFLK